MEKVSFRNQETTEVRQEKYGMTNAERKNRESENIEKMILIEILWYQERNCQKREPKESWKQGYCIK